MENRPFCRKSTADAVMVYDADDFSIIRTVNDLFLFVVVYEDDLLFFCSSYAFCAYHADVFAVIDDDIFAVVRYQQFLSVVWKKRSGSLPCL